jgi:hypothetical protein
MRLTTILVLALAMMGCGYGSRNYMNPGGGTATTPSVAALAPASTAAGSAGFTLTVNGSNFGTNSVVYFNGAAQTTMYVSANQVAAAITASEVASSGTIPVYVHSGIYNSNTVNFTVQ